VNPGPCFYPSRPTRESDGDGGDGDDLHARYVTVGGYCGEIADVKDVSVADFARGRDRSEGVHFVVWGVRLEIRSQN